MKWQDLRRSDNVEDRRGMSSAGGFGGGFGGGGGMIRTGGLGIGSTDLLVVIYLFGIDPLSLLSPDQSSPDSSSSASPGQIGNHGRRAVFAEDPRRHRRRGARSSAGRPNWPRRRWCCWRLDAVRAGGPPRSSVHRPVDRVYLTFFRELDRRFGAPGDFAVIIAHEVGHHVQNLVGVLQNRGGNAQSVRQELQADCLAGVWGHSRLHGCSGGDLEEALNAASAIGDDTLQRRSSSVMPESFTHGSSATASPTKRASTAATSVVWIEGRSTARSTDPSYPSHLWSNFLRSPASSSAGTSTTS
jgi:predicted metalloprotease